MGALPGARQTNNRAELWALLSFIASANGVVEYWTDSRAKQEATRTSGGKLARLFKTEAGANK
eukprot:9500073-Pyramimonas_sp.AAC.1